MSQLGSSSDYTTISKQDFRRYPKEAYSVKRGGMYGNTLGGDGTRSSLPHSTRSPDHSHQPHQPYQQQPSYLRGIVGPQWPQYSVRRSDEALLHAMVGVVNPGDIIPADLGPKISQMEFPGAVSTEGERGVLFSRYDYGLLYDSVTREVLRGVPLTPEMAQSAGESNRCFFLHLGIGVNIHPFSLQVACRHLARQVQDEVGSKYYEVGRDSLPSVLEYESYVDFQVLLLLWMREFQPYRIIVLSGSDARVGVLPGAVCRGM